MVLKIRGMRTFQVLHEGAVVSRSGRNLGQMIAVKRQCGYLAFFQAVPAVHIGLKGWSVFFKIILVLI